MESKAMQFAGRYLYRNGFDLEAREAPYIVAKNDGELAFVRVSWRSMGEKVNVRELDGRYRRGASEVRAFAKQWVADRPRFAETPCRFYTLAVLFASEDTAMVRLAPYELEEV